MPTELAVAIERFHLAQKFTISRGTKTEAIVIRVKLTRDGRVGQGECVPYARYDETPESTVAEIERLREAIANDLTREELQTIMPASAARNALDCAFWDLEAKQHGKSVAELLNLSLPGSCQTAQTIGLDTPEAMANAAHQFKSAPLLKIKLDSEGVLARLQAVRDAAPEATLVVDANEAWNAAGLQTQLDACRDLGVKLIEQPLPATTDSALENINRTVTLCADESAHDRNGLPDLAKRYDAINIKLDKTGGLTEALLLAKATKARGLRVMIGCMVSTSLSMAPALMLENYADWIDLDGPLWLKNDRPNGLTYQNGLISPLTSGLWGKPSA